MDFGQPATLNEAQALIGMVQYYRDMWPSQPHILDTMTEVDAGPKGRKIIWNNALGESFKDIKCMVYDEKLLNYTDLTITLTVQNDAYDKQLGAIISQDNKPIGFYQQY